MKMNGDLTHSIKLDGAEAAAKKSRPATQSSYYDESKNFSRLNKSREKEEYCKVEPAVLGSYEQEYSRQVENVRLLKSLVNPKRDKLIIKSLENVCFRNRRTLHGLKTGKGYRFPTDHRSK